MAKALWQLQAPTRTVGRTRLGRHGSRRGSVKQQVHDGDTIIVEADGNLSIRFLGVDTPETSFSLPDRPDSFVSTGSEEYLDFLGDPFTRAPADYESRLGPVLTAHLKQAVADSAATNHHELAVAAQRALEGLVEEDMSTLGQDKDSFRFFLAFANEVMDGYGRLLAFVNRDQPHAANPTPRPNSYNERLLEAGLAMPYFIWPNVNPFRRQESPVRALPRPGDQSSLATRADALGKARQWVRQARHAQIGLFSPGRTLTLEPFELRFLARRQLPSRWVIDLAEDNDRLLLPTSYHHIPHPENRLWIREEFVPLFEANGWRRA